MTTPAPSNVTDRSGLLIRCLTALMLGLLIVRPAAALGPQQTLLVVNGDSWASKTLANEYAHLRNLPEGSIHTLSGLPRLQKIEIPDFRRVMLRPVLARVADRSGEEAPTRLVVWSSDLPYHVDFRADLGRPSPDRFAGGVGSLTGLTFLHRAVMSGNADAYASLTSNPYATTRRGRGTRNEPSGFEVLRPTEGFERFLKDHEPRAEQERSGPPFLLSTMLGVTSGRGLSVAESLRQIRRSVSADLSRPDGKILYMVNRDVRSRTRQWGFEQAVNRLQALGVPAERLQGRLPRDEPKIAGLMLGVPGFDWAATGSVLQPGAIAEHLTSWGGVLTRSPNRQTPLTELLRHGAAGASGTVMEPLAIQAKFPDPFLHVHYAQGCTLAESFYQAVRAPYQLLIVGDALCRPWAEPPALELAGLEEGQTVSGRIRIRPRQVRSRSARLESLELWIDGRRLSEPKLGQPIEINTEQLADGYHELRLIARPAGPVAAQGLASRGFTVNNHGRSMSLSGLPEDGEVTWGQPLRIAASLSGAHRLVLKHLGREVGLIEGASGVFELDPIELGQGPARLRAMGLFRDQDGQDQAIRAEPMTLAVSPPQPVAASTDRPSGITPGFRLKLGDGAAPRTLVSLGHERRPWAEHAGVEPEQPFELGGWLQVDQPGVYQLQVRSGPRGLRLAVNDESVPLPKAKGPWSFLPMSLDRGWHRIALSGWSGPDPRGRSLDGPDLTVRFGGPGSEPIETRLFVAPEPGETLMDVPVATKVRLIEAERSVNAFPTTQPTTPPTTRGQDGIEPPSLRLRFEVLGRGLPPGAMPDGPMSLTWRWPARRSALARHPKVGWSITPQKARATVNDGAFGPVVFTAEYRGEPWQERAFFEDLPTVDAISGVSGQRLRRVLELPLGHLQEQRQPPPVKAPRVRSGRKAITVDGKLGEPTWQRAPDVGDLKHISVDRPVAQPTRAWFAWDESALYVAIECDEPNPSKVLSRVRRRDGPVFHDDSVELFLDADGYEEDDPRDYRQFVVNALGTLYDGKGFDKAWNSQARVAASAGASAWRVELAIPWSDLGVSPPTEGPGGESDTKNNVKHLKIRCLLARHRTRSEPLGVSQWPLARGSNHRPERFGTLIVE